MGLVIDEAKTKKMEVFIYLRSQVNSKNEIKQEIKGQIFSAKTCCYRLVYFKNGTASRITKIRFYKTLDWPVLTYTAE